MRRCRHVWTTIMEHDEEVEGKNDWKSGLLLESGCYHATSAILLMAIFFGSNWYSCADHGQRRKAIMYCITMIWTMRYFSTQQIESTDHVASERLPMRRRTRSFWVWPANLVRFLLQVSICSMHYWWENLFWEKNVWVLDGIQCCCTSICVDNYNVSEQCMQLVIKQNNKRRMFQNVQKWWEPENCRS